MFGNAEALLVILTVGAPAIIEMLNLEVPAIALLDIFIVGVPAVNEAPVNAAVAIELFETLIVGAPTETLTLIKEPTTVALPDFMMVTAFNTTEALALLGVAVADVLPPLTFQKKISISYYLINASAPFNILPVRCIFG